MLCILLTCQTELPIIVGWPFNVPDTLPVWNLFHLVRLSVLCSGAINCRAKLKKAGSAWQDHMASESGLCLQKMSFLQFTVGWKSLAAHLKDVCSLKSWAFCCLLAYNEVQSILYLVEQGVMTLYFLYDVVRIFLNFLRSHSLIMILLKIVCW